MCSDSNKKYYLKNKAAIAEYKKQYRIKNKERLKKLDKEWKNANKKSIKEKLKVWRKNNPNHNKLWRADNKDKVEKYKEANKDRSKYLYHHDKEYHRYQKEYAKNWRKSNKDKINEYQKSYYYLHIQEFAWRRILKNSLKRMNKKKSGRTIDLLGYSANELQVHITSLFKKGMSWDNYGDWHIDHKKAITKFSSDTPANIVNALSNLQPLWAFDNISKGNKDI